MGCMRSLLDEDAVLDEELESIDGRVEMGEESCGVAVGT